MGSPTGTPGSFRLGGHRLSYAVYGEGERVVVLLHGLLFSRRMHGPLAEALAARGNRVVTLDLLGHGGSDQPVAMQEYSMTTFARQVVALLDHLEADEAVIAGTSLGANTTLEVGALAPDRVRGMVVEMPVLDNALVACALAFTPLLVGVTLGAPLMRALSAGARQVPNARLPFLADILVEVGQRDPGPSAAILQGLFFGRVAPPREERQAIAAPALVIGHRRDPIHPFSDSGALADELPNARLLEADSIIELRVAPRRLTAAIGDFLDECWAPRGARRTARRAS